MRRVAVIVALNLAAAAAYAFVAAQMGFFSHMSDTLFWTPDSHSYRHVADWLFGGPNTDQSTHRPFLYPLLLGLFQRIAGDWGIWALNFMSWLATLNFTAGAAWRMTRRMWMGGIVFLVLATNVSIIVLSFQALTELVTLMLESTWILGLALSSIPPAKPRDFAMLLLPIALLAVVKPGYQLELFVALVLLGITIWRLPRGRVAAIAAMAACCIPIAFQLGLNAIGNHFIGLASTGEIELRDYYVAQVFAEVNGLPDDLAMARPVVDSWSKSQLASFLLHHPGPAVDTLVSNLHSNLTSNSNFIDRRKTPLLAAAVRGTNRAFLGLHWVFLPVVAIAIWLRRDMRLVLLYSFAMVLLLVPSLIFDQGDRYIQMAVPLWAAAYALAVSDLLPVISESVVGWRRKSSQSVPLHHA
jgi:hypothetical protein